MSAPRRANPGVHGLVLHPVVVIALALWIVNDHLLKEAWPGVVTGKLSDIAGLVAFPMVLLASLPTRLVCAVGALPAGAACAVVTASVYTAINVDAEVARVLTPLFAWLPRAMRVLAGADLATLAAPTAHVTDLEDLVALPFALATPYLVARRSTRRVRVGFATAATVATAATAATVAVAMFASMSAAHGQPPGAPANEAPRSSERARPSFALHVDALAGGVTTHEDNERGRYDYVSAGARLGIDGAYRRFRFGATGEFMNGSLTRAPDSYERYGVVHPVYRGFAIGARGGYEGRIAKLDVTLMYVQAMYAGGAGRTPFATGNLRVSLGHRERCAYSAQIGSADGFLVDGRFFDGGVLVERKRFAFRAAIGLGMLVVPDIAGNAATDHGIRLRAALGFGGIITIPDVLLDLEARVVLGGRVSLDAWIQGGLQWPRGRLGLVVTF